MSFLAPIAGTAARAVLGRAIGSRIAPALARVGSRAMGAASTRIGEFGLGKTANALGHGAADLASAAETGQAAVTGGQWGLQAGLNAPQGGSSTKQNFNQGIDVSSMYGE